MTDFVGCYLTTAGLELSAKSGVNIIFTRAETGSGVYTSPEGVKDLVGLKHKQYDHELEDVEIKGELADVIFYVTNRGVTEEYKLTEIGIYARAEGEEEILYCVAFAYEKNAEIIDAETAGQITYCRKFCIETKISADANVAVQIVGTDHEWAANYFKKYAGEVDLAKGTLQGQLEEISKPQFTVAKKRENITSREGLSVIFGKIAKFFGDLKAVAFSGSYSDLSDKPTAATQTKEGFMSASDKKKLDGVGTGANKISVVNNNTTTQAGLALDARQANPTIEGTLAATVAQLNNDSAKKAYLDSDGNSYAWMQNPVKNDIFTRVYVAYDDNVNSSFFAIQKLMIGKGVLEEFPVISSKNGLLPKYLYNKDDLNDVVGNFFLEVYGSKNVPVTGANFYGLNMCVTQNTQFEFQLLIAPNADLISGSITPKIYMRSKMNGVWNPWHFMKGTLLS